MKQKIILWALFLVQGIVRDKLPPLLKKLDDAAEKRIMKTMFPKTAKLLGEKDDVR